MKNLFSYFIFLTSIFLTGCQDGPLVSNLISEVEYLKNYPYTIYAKTTDEISILQSEFDSLNENKICTVLDQFGFTDKAHCREEVVDENIVDQKKIISLVKSTLVRNSKYTNVLDTTHLNVKIFKQVAGSPFNYKIIFEEQVVEGLTVEESRIEVFFYGNYVYQIRGSWYPEIPIPPKEYGYSISKAKNKIIGKKFEFYCWGPAEITITRQFILDEYTEKCIYPLVDDKSIEFRVVYRFLIGKNAQYGPFFNIYVDIITGEIINFRPLFAC